MNKHNGGGIQHPGMPARRGRAGLRLVSMLMVMIFVATLAVQPAAAGGGGTSLYVSKAGSDSGNCTSASSPCKTIAYAMSQAIGLSTITIGAGTWTENLAPTMNMNFSGAGMDITIIDGSGIDSVINGSIYNISVAWMTLQNGHATNGGGIHMNAGSLYMHDVKVTGNRANFGAGIYSSGTVIIADSMVSNNNANVSTSGFGGGLYLADIGGTDTLQDVTISGNTATDSGGGINTGEGQNLNLTNVTITGNTAKYNGAMSISDTTTNNILNSTIANNHFSAGGATGGIQNWGTIYFKNTIVAGNDGANCSNSWTITSQGYNLDSGTSCSFTGTGDLQSTDPKLGPLALNSSNIPTMALLDTSPAINAGTNTGCPGTDARKISRPQGTTCDIGAFEYLTPTGFNKTLPANAATLQPTNPTLSWGTSSGAASYKYCIDTSNNSTCNTSWISTGTTTHADLSGLTPGATYYWQARAVNIAGSTYANSSTWWSFSVAPLAPGAFNKSTPTNAASGQPTNPTLTWGTSSGATSYRYCIDTSNNSACNASWISTGTTTHVDLSGLTPGSTYYWQVRAINATSSTYANSSTWWSFSVAPLAPGAFSKSSPTNAATGQATNPTLTWAASSGATSYRYCIDTSNNSACNAAWISTGTTTHVDLSGLTPGSTYYWQVRGINGTASTYANSGTWWSFTVHP